MSSLDSLRALGYSIDESMPAAEDRPTVYFVTGPGVAMYVAEDDYDMQQSLLASHDERVLAQP